MQTLAWVPSGFKGGRWLSSQCVVGERLMTLGCSTKGATEQITPLELSLPICPKVFLPGPLPSSLTGHFLFTVLKAGPARGLCGWELH